jgi:hypothetical protein
MNKYLKQAETFLSKNCLKMSIIKKNTKRPEWVTECHGDHYRITISKKSKRISFDFWGSINDMKNGIKTNSYDVLSCISGDIHMPETFKDYCSEFGASEDSRKAFNDFKRCYKFGKKLRNFLTKEEQEQLSEIQ